MATAIRLESTGERRPAQLRTSSTVRDVASLRAILDRWMSHFYEPAVCTCVDCRRLREQPFVCATCGFSDTPVVRPCVCGDGDRQRIAALRVAVRQARELGRDRVFAYTPREAKAALRRAVDLANAHTCRVSDPRCAHGRVACRVCLSIAQSAASSCAAPTPVGERFAF